MNGNDLFTKRRLRSASTGAHNQFQSQIEQFQEHQYSSVSSSQDGHLGHSSQNQQYQFLNNKQIQEYLKVFSPKRQNDALLATLLLGIELVKSKLNGQLHHASLPQLQELLSSFEDENKRNKANANKVMDSARNLQKTLQEKFQQLEIRNQEIQQQGLSYSKPSSGWRQNKSGNNHSPNPAHNHNSLDTDDILVRDLNGSDRDSDSDFDNYEIEPLQPLRRKRTQNQKERNERRLVMHKLQMIEESLHKQQKHQQSHFPPSPTVHSPMGYFPQPAFYPPSPSPSSTNQLPYYPPSPIPGYHQPGFFHHQQFSHHIPHHPPTVLPQNNQYTYYPQPNAPINFQKGDILSPVEDIPSQNDRDTSILNRVNASDQHISHTNQKQSKKEELSTDNDKIKGSLAWSLDDLSEKDVIKKKQPRKPVKNTKQTSKSTKNGKQTPQAKPSIKREKYIPTRQFGLPYNPKKAESRIKDRIMMDKQRLASSSDTKVTNQPDEVLVLYKTPRGNTWENDSKQTESVSTVEQNQLEAVTSASEKRVHFSEEVEVAEDSYLSPITPEDGHAVFVQPVNKQEDISKREEIQMKKHYSIQRNDSSDKGIEEQEAPKTRSFKTPDSQFSNIHLQSRSPDKKLSTSRQLQEKVAHQLLSNATLKPLSINTSPAPRDRASIADQRARPMAQPRQVHHPSIREDHSNTSSNSLFPGKPMSAMDITRQFLNNKLMQDFLYLIGVVNVSISRSTPEFFEKETPKQKENENYNNTKLALMTTMMMMKKLLTNTKHVQNSNKVLNNRSLLLLSSPHGRQYSYVNKNFSNEFISELKSIFTPEQVTLNETTRTQHGTSLTHHRPMAPDAVVFPRSTQEVSQLVALCHRYQVPVIPYGAGTALEGHFDALNGGVSIDLSQHMNNVVQFYPDDMNITVEAGITREGLNEYIRESGLFFPIDPGANATIGGMTSTRASGTNAVRYGTMKENVVNVTCVLPDAKGTIIKTNRRAKKSSAGYDLTSLMIGSEGTLGVITEITLKLYGVPECVTAAVCSFPDLNSAAQCVSTCIQIGVPLARVELMDENCIKAVNKYSKLTLDDSKPMLFFEFFGSQEGVREQVELVKQIAQEDFGASDFDFKHREEERQILWRARHMAYLASLNLRPGCKGMITDVCVPISKLAECIVATKEDVDNSGLMYTVVGHVGDGNFHVILLLDEDNPDEVQKAHEVNDRLVKRAIEADGTCTGEHGVGHGKMEYLLAEHGPDAVEMMRLLKKSIDPLNIMNPGKIISPEDVVEQYRKTHPTQQL